MVTVDESVQQPSLTFETWKDWYSRHQSLQVADYWANDDYEILSESPRIFREFLSYPEGFKARIAEMISASLDIETIETVVELRLRLSVLYPDSEHPSRSVGKINWLTDSTSRIIEYCRKQMFGVTRTKFSYHHVETDVDRYVLFCRETAKNDYYITPDDSDSVREILWLLIALLGPNKMSDMIRLWMNGSTLNHSICHFLLFIDNYEEYKEYPVNWALELLLEGER